MPMPDVCMFFCTAGKDGDVVPKASRTLGRRTCHACPPEATPASLELEDARSGRRSGNRPRQIRTCQVANATGEALCPPSCVCSQVLLCASRRITVFIGCYGTSFHVPIREVTSIPCYGIVGWYYLCCIIIWLMDLYCFPLACTCMV